MMYIDVLFLFVLFSIFVLILCRPKTNIPFFEACHGEECNWYADSRYTGCRPSDEFLLRFPYFDESSTIDFRCLSVQQIFIRSDFDCRNIPLIVEHAKNMPSVFVGEAETQCVIWRFHYAIISLIFITGSQPFHELYVFTQKVLQINSLQYDFIF